MIALTLAPLADLPFESVGNRIYLRAELNGREINAVLDTGASVSLIDERLAKEAGVKRTQAVSASGSGSKFVKAWLVSHARLKLVGTRITHTVPVALSPGNLNPYLGKPLDAVLGYDFLVRYRFEIDYAAHRLRVYDATLHSIPERAVVLPVRFVDNQPLVRGRISIPETGSAPVSMMLDTGAATSFDLTNRFVRDRKLGVWFGNAPEIVIGGGIGGDTKGRRIRLDAASLGTAKLRRPIATLDTTPGGDTGKNAAFDVLVGGETFRRFTVTLDYPHKRIFLEANAGWSEPFVGDRTGLSLMVGEDGYRVWQVVARSPAVESGVHLDDIVTEIEGRRPRDLEGARQALHEAVGILHLAVRRESKTKTVEPRTRELVP